MIARLQEPEGTAIFTDFDGTLAEIVADPETATPRPGISEALRALAARCPVVAVVSGRPVSFLLGALGYPSGEGPHPQLCGVHGLERWTATGGTRYHPEAEGYRVALDAADRLARDALGAGIAIEHKGLGVTLHWRRHPEAERLIRSTAERLAAQEGLAVVEGKMCVELVPDLGFDKGSAVSTILAETPGVRRACFIGDDIGDLQAFRALDRAPGIGSVKIAVSGDEVPPALLAAADAVLDSPAEVAEMLVEFAGR